MGNGGGTQDDGIDHQSAKHLLDSIGKKVHDQVKNGDAKNYISELKGLLSLTPFFGGELASSNDPCKLVDNYRIKTSYTGTSSNPCRNATGNDGKEIPRFSDKQQAEYDNKKTKCSYDSNGSKGKGGNSEGACAPYRRLSLCNKNLEYLNEYDSSKAKHYLLAKVCYAAKHEGESLKSYNDQYNLAYDGTASQICTVLARSFADIGDIVRGRDLYSGNKKKDKLQDNLKTIFGNIYNKLLDENKKNGEIKGRYGNDGDNYFKLREDWWTANRETVWKALTCDDRLGGNRYFRQTCGGDNESLSHASQKCRCRNNDFRRETDQVPTYFDYVPQYLRWFEEWAEDFCRKKKKNVENAIKKCRGDYGGEKRYCSRNGCDCKKTVRARGKLRYGNRCIDCLYACTPYVEWIDNQKEQFHKQVKKYTDEINRVSGSRRLRRDAGGATTSNYDGYEKKFYNILKGNDVGGLENFLDLLNKEPACQAVKDDKGGKIDFKTVDRGGGTSGSVPGGGTSDSADSNSNKTFYHSEYCQLCPHCGMRKKRDGTNEWEPKTKDDNCKNGNLYGTNENATATDIKILKSGEKQKDIAEKLNQFCNEGNVDKDSLYETWKCYEGKDVVKVAKGEEDEDEEEEDDDYTSLRKSGGLCILENKKKEKEVKETNSQKEPEQFQKPFVDFFTYWVAHMLKDSIYWKKELKKCLEKEKKTCKNNKCEKPCECFAKWVEQKKTNEWRPIKEHFYKQDGFDEAFNHHMVLDYNLQLQFSNENSSEDSQSRDEDAEEMKHLKKILKLENGNGLAAVNAVTKNNTTIDRLIEHEEGIVTKCKECKKPEDRATGESPLRSLDDPPSPRVIPRITTKDAEESEDSSEEDEDEEQEENENEGDGQDE
ncbi:erythrocyte membrane protein 1, EMP1, partial [Plasmodium reichenowi]